MMIKFKKIAAVFTTIAAIAINGTSAISVSAEYDSCDVNRDGSVGVSDIAILNKYLNGQFSVSNYNQLDVNKSLTIDAADSECILAKVLKYSYEAKYISRNGAEADTEIDFPTVSGFAPDSSAANTASREYMRYSYVEQKQLENYTLTPTFSTLNMGVNSRAVIGTDDRYRASGEENTGIVKLNVIVNGQVASGTGFVVGDHQIATAAHCVYDFDEDVWYPMQINTYNSDGELTNVTLTPVEAHIPEIYDSFENYYYDYALITVEEDLSDYVHFSIANSYNVTATDYADIPIYITGRPGEVHGKNNKYLYSAQGNVIDEKIANIFLIHCNVDASDGESGSPIYTITKQCVDGEESYIYTALGVYYGGSEYSVGPLFTKYHLQFYHNNPNMNYITEN